MYLKPHHSFRNTLYNICGSHIRVHKGSCLLGYERSCILMNFYQHPVVHAAYTVTMEAARPSKCKIISDYTASYPGRESLFETSSLGRKISALEEIW
jgi:hypothetical protein